MTEQYDRIAALVRDALVEAGSTFRQDKKAAYRRAIASAAAFTQPTVGITQISFRIPTRPSART